MNVVRTEMPTWQCYDLIRAVSVGRLCVVDHDTPLAFPVNFRLVETPNGPRVVVRTSPNTIVARHVGPMSFEVDEIDTVEQRAWSVIIRGRIQPVHGEHSLPDPGPWVTEGRDSWIVIEPTAVSGRRFVAVTSADGFSVEWELAPG